ncbi:hypothetical protein RFA42_004178 [Vibrio vulnificus]|uniref:hypothetical protein n=1 Tax=Vibrio TaxID=662 RepID=UPI0005EEEB61|nr:MULTISPECIES: hypothetical protein [Vibrio]EGR0148918.1 hypothetical protein [Vibrio alginolyticus]EKO3844865.1 hypothetical protein [Vibrio harveyi]HBC3449565.1 hypothetical protein [Vibrio parahaemolyticus]EJI1281210.1 hypothetical protein [Vibrio vulnificus]EKD7165499.1 hypothetical protein [Vibrio vulnificus]
MNSKILFSLREVIVVFLSGGLPILLAYHLGGIELLNSTINALISPDLLLYYAVGAAFMFGIFYWIDDRIYINPLGRAQGILNFIISTLSEVSTNILGIFRVVSGLLIVFPFFVLFVEPESFQPIGLEFIKIGLMGLVECGLFCWFHSKAKLKQKF